MSHAAASPADVIARRRREQAAAIDVARRFVAAIPAEVDVRAAAVVGSTVRGDFNKWSDIDVVVIAEPLPDDSYERIIALGERPPGVQFVAWTPDEFARALARRDPLAQEAETIGVWLVGPPA